MKIFKLGLQNHVIAKKMDLGLSQEEQEYLEYHRNLVRGWDFKDVGKYESASKQKRFRLGYSARDEVGRVRSFSIFIYFDEETKIINTVLVHVHGFYPKLELFYVLKDKSFGGFELVEYSGGSFGRFDLVGYLTRRDYYATQEDILKRGNEVQRFFLSIFQSPGDLLKLNIVEAKISEDSLPNEGQKIAIEYYLKEINSPGRWKKLNNSDDWYFKGIQGKYWDTIRFEIISLEINVVEISGVGVYLPELTVKKGRNPGRTLYLSIDKLVSGRGEFVSIPLDRQGNIDANTVKKLQNLTFVKKMAKQAFIALMNDKDKLIEYKIIY